MIKCTRLSPFFRGEPGNEASKYVRQTLVAGPCLKLVVNIGLYRCHSYLQLEKCKRGGGGGGDNFSLYKADKDKTIVFWAGPSTIS